MKTLSLLAVIAATATPALAEFNPENIISQEVVQATGNFGGGNIDNNPR